MAKEDKYDRAGRKIDNIRSNAALQGRQMTKAEVRKIMDIQDKTKAKDKDKAKDGSGAKSKAQGGKDDDCFKTALAFLFGGLVVAQSLISLIKVLT